MKNLNFDDLNVIAGGAETIKTSSGTYQCDNQCVVGKDGSVSDSAGGSVYKLVE